MELQLNFFTYVAIYLILGAAWASLMEYLTTGNVPGELGDAWSNWERVGHGILWPISFISFVVAFIQNFK